MKRMLAFRELLAVASMLFGLFFGAGNLIFPASMGQLAGSAVWMAAAGFLITGVGLPLLGVAALGISQEELAARAVYRRVEAGTVLHRGDGDCLGLLVLRSGQLRAYIVSEEGREVTLYRLFEMDMCLFSASCMLRNIQFEVTIQAEKDTEFWVIPTEVYRRLTEESAAVANYTNDLMASRFSEVMWLMEQIMWKSFDKRLAEFLLEESALEGTDTLKLTHEAIGNHLGNPREVVTRMLHYFHEEGMVSLSRGTVRLLDREKLETLCRK